MSMLLHTNETVHRNLHKLSYSVSSCKCCTFYIAILHIRFGATIHTHKIVDDLRGLHLVIVHYSRFTVSHKPIFNTSLNASVVKYWVVDSV